MNTIPFKLQFRLGWALIGIISFNIVVNLGLTVVETVVSIYKGYKRNKLAKQKNQDIMNFFLQKRKITEDENNTAEFVNLKYSDDFIKALEFCIEWKVHRTWLISNKVEIINFPEEVLYKRFYKKFKFKEEIKKMRLRQALAFAVHKKTANQLGQKVLQARKQERQDRVKKMLENKSHPEIKALKLKTPKKVKVNIGFVEAKTSDKKSTSKKKLHGGLGLSKIQEEPDQESDSPKNDDYGIRFKENFSGALGQNIMKQYQAVPDFMQKAVDDVEKIKADKDGFKKSKAGDKVNDVDVIIKHTDKHLETFKF